METNTCWLRSVNSSGLTVIDLYDLKTKEEYDFVVKKAEVLSEENIMLKEEISLLKKVEESDSELKAMYEETLSSQVQTAPPGEAEVRQTEEQIPEPVVTEAAAGTEFPSGSRW